MRLRTATILLACVLLGTTAITADSGPTLSSLDKRERQHYKNLDKRLRAATALLLSQTVQQRIESGPMDASHNSVGATFYTGGAVCPSEWIATGGGVDWGVPNPRGDWVITFSRPAAEGTGWATGVFVGTEEPPSPPTAYAVCIRHN